MTGPASPPGPPASGELPFVVGVDGGGSGSRAQVMDPAGKVLASAEGPPALVELSRPSLAAEAIAGSVLEAVERAGVGLPAQALWAGVAGGGRPEAREGVESSLGALGLAAVVGVGMDVEGAHRDAFGTGPGIVLVVGTGSMAWGRKLDGGEVRVGGWGSLLGEEGSGYWLGMEGLRGVARSFDGREPPTRLSQKLLGILALPDADALLTWIATATKRDVAALAPAVLAVAQEGDPAARSILQRGLGALGEYLDAVGRHWDSPRLPVPLALAGGLVGLDGPLRDPLERMVEERGMVLLSQEVLPVRGAAMKALDLLSRSGG